MSRILSQIHFRLVTVITVIEILIVDKPSRGVIIMFIHHRNTHLSGEFPAFLIITALIERAYRSDYGHFGIFLLHRIENHGETFFKDIGNQILVTNTDVLQIERFGMSGLRTLLSPHGLLRISIRIFYQIQYILHVLRHFLHRDSALLTAATQFAYRVMTASTRILTRHSGCHYRNRFGPHILAEQKIFMISQTAGLMIPPQIAQRLAFLQRSYRAFPIINIVHTISVSHTSAGETDKTGMKVRQSLCQISAQPVLPAFKCILWEKRNHIQGILPSHLRTNGQHGIRSIRRCRQYSLLFFPLCR